MDASVQNDRNSLLAAMTDEVGTLVLRNNYLQTLALSLAERKGVAETGFLTRLMQSLEQRGLLDRAVEFLPDDVAIAERTRRGQPFTRPELAVLLAYAKLTLYDDLLASGVPDDPYLARELSQYFPHEVRDKFPEFGGIPSPSAGDHLHQSRQCRDQSRRPGLRGAPDRRDRCRRTHHRHGLRGGG